MDNTAGSLVVGQDGDDSADTTAMVGGAGDMGMGLGAELMQNPATLKAGLIIAGVGAVLKIGTELYDAFSVGVERMLAQMEIQELELRIWAEDRGTEAFDRHENNVNKLFLLSKTNPKEFVKKEIFISQLLMIELRLLKEIEIVQKWYESKGTGTAPQKAEWFKRDGFKYQNPISNLWMDGFDPSKCATEVLPNLKKYVEANIKIFTALLELSQKFKQHKEVDTEQEQKVENVKAMKNAGNGGCGRFAFRQKF